MSLVAVFGLFAAPSGAAEPTNLSPVGRKIDDFTLRDEQGANRSLADFKASRLVVVAFLGCECPLAKLYAARLNELADEYRQRGVAFVAINSNVQDSVTEIAAFARRHELKYPVWKDPGNTIADRFSAERTPEVFLLDGERKVRYHGRIDDQYGVGYQRPKATRRDLATAIDELLQGQPVSQPHTDAPGCIIGRTRQPQANSELTYSRDIAPILQRHCVECHRPGEIAPFPLTTYEETFGWAEMMAEVVRANRMPPWHADPRYGHFANDARLPDADKAKLLRWVQAGAPEGNPRDLPAPRKFTTDWKIPKPDLEVFMSDKPASIPAAGEVKYRYYVVDPGFKEDHWVKAAECKPGNRGVVHHIIVFVQAPGDQRIPGGEGRRGGRIDDDWLAATAPGSPPMILPDGYAKRIPAGSRLVFQMHYTPNGSPQTDRSSIGLVFVDKKTVHKEVGTWRAATAAFAIPPGDDNYRAEAWHTFGKDTLLLAMFPHMHLRGKSFRYEAQYPDGRTEILLDVPRYDFGWQNAYALAEPKRIPAGTRLKCTAHYDNSAGNLSNPDPRATVRWGDQTWEEMMIGYFSHALADQDLQQKPATPRTDKFLAAAREGKAKVDDELRRLAAVATKSPDDFARFAARVQAIAPQVDRLCLTSVGDGKLRIEFAAQPGELQKLLGGRGLEVRTSGLAVALYATEAKAAVHDDLSTCRERDLATMSRGVNSSCHAPANHQGRQATLNAWSRETAAFPPEAQEFLRALAEAVSATEGTSAK